MEGDLSQVERKQLYCGTWVESGFTVSHVIKGAELKDTRWWWRPLSKRVFVKIQATLRVS